MQPNSSSTTLATDELDPLRVDLSYFFALAWQVRRRLV
eukprot:COSAG01_NODE_7406_length_3218_cov_3.756168_5_plen_37_part_01